MFRVTRSVVAARKLLYRYDQPCVQIAAITSSSTKYKKLEVRDPCPIPPPPPPPPSKDDSMFWGAMTLLFLAGGFVGYVKSNTELRDWLTLNAAWIDDLIAIVHQENMTFGELSKQYVDDLKNAFLNIVNEERPQQCSNDGKLLAISNPEQKISSLQDKEGNENFESHEKIAHPFLAKDICEIDRCIQELGDTAIHSYTTARKACAYYNKLVEETMAQFNLKNLKRLHGAMEERVTWVNESVEKAIYAAAKLDELVEYFDQAMQAPMEAKKKSQDMLRKYRDKVKAIQMKWQNENDMSLARDVQWQKVEALVNKYTEENQMMFKGLDYFSEKPSWRGDPDLLLYHSLRYVELLKDELSEELVEMTERIDSGMETLPQGEKEMKDREAYLQAYHKNAKAELHAEYQKRADDQKAENENYLRNSLKRQLQHSQETMEQRLKQKEIEAIQKLEELVAAQVESEKRDMAKDIVAMSTKLKIHEVKLNARLKAERETRRSQQLWSAGASLLAATKKGDPYVNVNKELEAIEKASGNDDKLVLSVLKAIPQSVREKGVVPENVLKKKYHMMEAVALKVALVKQEGAPLAVYFLSYLQSIFLFMKITGIPQEEFDKPSKELSKGLDTFDLLQRARFWIDRGNIAAALIYVTALEGASRAASASWQDAARSYLETRQAAEAVLAHATAMGLQFV